MDDRTSNNIQYTATPGGHLTAMQLFYELKQKFPTAPDPVVSECIRQSKQDPERCEALLRASCASRGFPAACLTSIGRRFSAPPSGVSVLPSGSTTESSSTTFSSTTVSRARSAGRNSMCALAERTSTSTASSSNIGGTTTTTVNNNNNNNDNSASGNINNNNNNVVLSNPRSKLRPTFLNTRPPQSQQKLINSNNVQQELRSPFLGGPLQEPHKHQCSNINNNCDRRKSSLQQEEYYTSESYKCSVNQESISLFDTQLPDWSSREPTPPPRPPLPASMVQDPLLSPFNHRLIHQDDDFIHQDYEVSVNCSLHGVHVTSTCSSPVSGPSGSPLKHTASLHVHPSPHFLPSHISSSCEPRSYTSVNLTLRPPSSEPQPPIDIRSASRLTYSTSSYNPRQGFQSQLHIQIGAGGGTVSALRTSSQPPMGISNTRSNNNINVPSSPTSSSGGRSSTPIKQHQVLVRTISLPDVSTPLDKQVSTTHQAGLMRQMERKERLELELRREKERLMKMQREVSGMEKDLQRRQARKAIAPLIGTSYSSMQRVDQLRVEISALQQECNRMTQEVDLHGSQVPLGETDEEFYQNIYTGQRGFILPTNNLSQPTRGSWSLPPRIQPQSNSRVSENVDEDEEDGPHWTCSVCTFRNHPALGKCEQCEMPRISLDVTEAETQDIHIRVTHSNFPARRVVHSWVV